jgi:hypothetical protein
VFSLIDFKKVRVKNPDPSIKNVKIAGGFFTKYLNNNYAQLFPDFKVYFDRTKDIDVYYVNKKKRKTYNGEIYGNFYIKLYFKERNDSLFNFVASKKKKKDESKEFDNFDYDPCK